MRYAAVGVALAVASCGGTVERETAGAGSGGSGADGAGAGSGTGAESGTGATSGSGAAGTGAEGTGGAGAQTGGGGGGGAANGNVAYAVTAWPGGLDHLIVMRADEDANTCIRLFIDAPTQGQFSVVAPEPWGVNAIEASEGSVDCLNGDLQSPGPGVYAIMASGSVSWDLEPGNYYPCELSLDVTADFNQAPPWLEPSVSMQAVDIKVDGGCF